MEQLFYSNLQLLGFNSVEHAEKFKVQFTPTMFRTSNVRGMEVVLHFLLEKLDSKNAAEQFRDIWPVYDKLQAQEFKKKVHDRIASLEQDGFLPRGTMRMSHLQTCCGERFVILVWRLSTFVLNTVYLQEHGSTYPIAPLPPTLSLAATKLHIQRETRIFLAHARRAQEAQQRWQASADQIITEYRDLVKQDAGLRDQLTKFEQRSEPAMFGEIAALERSSRVNDVRAAWENVLSLASVCADNQDLVENVMGKRVDQYRLGDDALQVSAPPVSPSKFEHDLVVGLRREGRIDLTQLVKLWKSALQALQRAMGAYSGMPSASKLPDLQSFLDSVTDQLHEQQDYLSALRGLSHELVEQSPRIQQSLKMLRQEADISTSLVMQTESKEHPSVTPARSRKVNFGEPDTATETRGPFALEGMTLVPPTPYATYVPRADQMTFNTASTPGVPLQQMAFTPAVGTQPAMDRKSRSAARRIDFTPDSDTEDQVIQDTGPSPRRKLFDD